MAAPLFLYAERLPAPALAMWFSTYWEFSVRDGAPPMHHVPPDGCTSLTFILGGPERGAVLLSGPWLEPLAVPVWAGSRFVGVRLRAGGVRGALGVDPDTLRNRSVPADTLVGPLVARLRTRLLASVDLDDASATFDELFGAEVEGMQPTDPLVDRAVDALVTSHGELAIAALARDLATSERTLLRRFKAATGLTPKQFARIRRLLAAAWQVVDGRGTWSEIAAGAGYADQPHLHHDVVGLTGLRPEVFGSRIRSTEHDQVKR